MKSLKKIELNIKKMWLSFAVMLRNLITMVHVVILMQNSYIHL